MPNVEGMEGIDFNGFTPKNTIKDLNSKQNADAFFKMGEELDPETPKPLNNKEQIQSGMPSGPKYMEALDSIMTLADIRAIEVELPILKTKVQVSPMTGQEEQALRTAAVSPESFLKKINELLYKHTSFESNFVDFSDFLSKLFPPDKSMLIWALMSSTYMVLPTVDKECASCGKKYIIDSVPGDLIHGDTITEYWDKEQSPTDFTSTQSVLNGYINFEMAMPSEKDRVIITSMITPNQAKDNIEKTGSLLSFTDNLIFFTRSVAVGEENKRVVLTNAKQDIYPFLNNIPPKIKDAIHSGVDLTIFDKYMPKFYLESRCTNCQAKEKIDIDPEIAFFRKTISL